MAILVRWQKNAGHMLKVLIPPLSFNQLQRVTLSYQGVSTQRHKFHASQTPKAIIYYNPLPITNNTLLKTMGSCNSALNKPCLSETDNRYDANFPKGIAEQVSLHIRPVVTIGYEWFV